MPNTRYDASAGANYATHFGGNAPLTNPRLQNYFNGCFQQSIDEAGCYPAWACLTCMAGRQPTAEFGNRPTKCPTCDSRETYEIATFQARSSVVGNAFEAAVRYILITKFELPAMPTPGNTRTHDIEVTPRIAIEAKGSPRQLLNPDRTVTRFPVPGMERSDTKKKAFDNAHTFRQRNPRLPFYIVSNAVPSDLVGYRSEDVTGIFNITQANRTESLVAEINAALA